MDRKKPVTVTTTKTRAFASPGEARMYAHALASHGQISKPELRGVERTTRAAEHSSGKKR
jgi:hypothetical protein